MERSNLLPDEVADWLHSLSRPELRSRLTRAINERTTKAGVAFDKKSLAAAIEAHDTCYFDAQESGRGDEAMREFKHARLLSAQLCLLEGDEEEAVYEFFHSLDDATPEALRETLKKG